MSIRKLTIVSEEDKRLIFQLREETGVGVAICKKVIMEYTKDIKEAKKLLKTPEFNRLPEV